MASNRSRRRVWVALSETKMCMLDEIRAKRDEIYAIAKRHKAEKLCVFGSCVLTKAYRDDGFEEVRNG